MKVAGRVKSHYSIIIIGCGASAGFFLSFLNACEALEKRNILVLEKTLRPFRKIHASGNGRCNYSNISMNEGDYISLAGSKAWQKEAFKRVSELDLKSYLFNNGIPSRHDEYGRLFPYTNSAKTIAFFLEQNLSSETVDTQFDTEVTVVTKKSNEPFVVEWKKEGRQGRAFSDIVIYAAGGSAYQELGTDGSSLLILKKLGHMIIPQIPGIVPLETPKSVLHNIAGIKMEVEIYFKDLFKRKGELLFTEYGISGPNTLYASSVVSQYREKGRVEIHIDFLPEKDLTAEYFKTLYHKSRDKTWPSIFGGVLPHSFISAFIRAIGLKPECHKKCLSEETLRDMYRKLKDFRLEITGTRPLEEAQVSLGGISCDEVNPRTFESQKTKGLYILGEALDYTGGCGGYNIHWCAATAYAASQAIA
ncbi:MAG: hypothetical protein COS99_03225 [Candidatus Omnitrophica bacterium CG07_land_8_20_14_0_80_42_15]|uniref:Aminoacetone oxidase family FAD-binding enzyme n=1 Tax=Candidatus Aquitaenariimonas noxiae TaxID=1974741 RepID=A0A2J0KZG2_9BACT|nr:MAG: hypothetical protein COS99_03225 [Candidatus Omnitrophica bacterium CG07_land_8_20_14_0_80_42_15]